MYVYIFYNYNLQPRGYPKYHFTKQRKKEKKTVQPHYTVCPGKSLNGHLQVPSYRVIGVSYY